MSARICLAVSPLRWESLKKIKDMIYFAVLAFGLAIMISPLPEDTMILSLALSYLGYNLTGNIYITILIYVATFIITIILIKKLRLIAKFKARLKHARAYTLR